MPDVAEGVARRESRRIERNNPTEPNTNTAGLFGTNNNNFVNAPVAPAGVEQPANANSINNFRPPTTNANEQRLSSFYSNNTAAAPANLVNRSQAAQDRTAARSVGANEPNTNTSGLFGQTNNNFVNAPAPVNASVPAPTAPAGVEQPANASSINNFTPPTTNANEQRLANFYSNNTAPSAPPANLVNRSQAAQDRAAARSTGANEPNTNTAGLFGQTNNNFVNASAPAPAPLPLPAAGQTRVQQYYRGLAEGNAEKRPFFTWLAEICTGPDSLFTDEKGVCKFNTPGLEFPANDTNALYTNILTALGVPEAESKLTQFADYVESIPKPKTTPTELMNVLSELLELRIHVNGLTLINNNSQFIMKIYNNVKKNTYKICSPSAPTQTGGRRTKKHNKAKKRSTRSKKSRRY
jgi:hypothetical protein